MEIKRKIYVVGWGRGYANWMEGKIVDSMKESDLVVFTGGEDISPALYGKQPHPQTYWNDRRDDMEVRAFKEAKGRGKKMIGICRGAQLFCALAGGTLVQHQTHPWVHRVQTREGEFFTNSLHHQRAYPWGGKQPRFELLAWCEPGFSSFNYGESYQDKMDGKPEAEVVMYPDINALAIQGHPEMLYPPRKGMEEGFLGFCRRQLDRLMES